MKKTLIVRSASFQQLDMNLPVIVERFKGSELHLLTHGHGVSFAEKYKDISKVVVYTEKGNFKAGVVTEGLEPVDYADIVVLVANTTGAGFGNVFDYALSLGGARIHMCNVVGAIRELERGSLRRSRVLEGVYKVAASLLGAFLGAIALVWFLGAVAVANLRRKEPTP